MLSGLSAKHLDRIDDGVLAMLLGVCIQDVQRKARTRFNARSRLESRDGNGTSFLTLFRWPVMRVRDVRVETPILGFIRVYQTDEIKIYSFQGQLRIFTYKMVAATMTGGSMATQTAWGTIFPPLPQCVHVTYNYGFGQYDAAANLTTYDGGTTSEAGDTRHEDEEGHLLKLQMAALCDAAASYLAQIAGQAVGLITAVSFDGFSKSMNPQAYGPQVQSLIERRDELLERQKRPFMVTVGIHE